MVNRGDGQHEHQARAKQKGHVVSDCAEKKKAAERKAAREVAERQCCVQRRRVHLEPQPRRPPFWQSRPHFKLGGPPARCHPHKAAADSGAPGRTERAFRLGY